MKTVLASLLLVGAASVSAQSQAYGQCGGIGWTGATTCVSGYSCNEVNAYYFQCLPGAATTPTPTSTTTGASGTGSATSSLPNCSVTSTPPASAGKVQFAGVNIAGFDFGCGTDGTCNTTQAYPPIGGTFPDGPGQMTHFTNEGLNVFRLPVGWQYLVNNHLGGTLDSTNAANYDKLVQACLTTGAHCIIDIHNYARWNGGIVGQGGPANSDLTNLWTQLATKYASQSKIIFGVMNEPHDIPSITTWGATVQAVVTAIRNAGATSQLILLPGNDYTGAGTFISDGSAAALITVTNPDGTTDNLIFDVHKYLDSDNSGTHAECTTNNIDGAFAPLAQYLRCHGRQAFLTETGGGNVASCETDLCQELAYLNENSDVYLGWVGWSAGSFDSTYILDLVPKTDGTDQPLASQCIIGEFTK